MKKSLLFCCFLFVFGSCAEDWDGENGELFRQSCLEDANTWAANANQAKVYCDCVMEKLKQKYPTVKEALEKADSVMVDPDLRQCRSTIQYE